MTHNEIFDKVSELFKDAFGKDTVITEETKRSDIKAWDSFAHMQLLSNIDKAFSVKLKMKQIIKIESVGDIVNAVSELLG